MSKLSIKLKVTLWYVIVLIIISSTALIAMMSMSKAMLMKDATDKLTRGVENVAMMLRNPRENLKEIPQFRFFDQGVHTAIYDSDFQLINGSVPFEFNGDIEFSDGKMQELVYEGEEYLSYVSEIKTKRGEALWVKGVIAIADEGQMLKNVLKTNLMLIIILIFAAAVGGYFIIKRSFKPVEMIRKTAVSISEGNDLSQRIAIGEGNDEICRLANSFDDMLDKIEKTLENEKQFTSDASHELRTPVAVITSECEYVLDCAKDIDEAKESVESIKRQADKMTKLISELLTISRMDRSTIALNFEKIDLSELLSFVCDEQEEIRQENITLIRNISPDISAYGDRVLLTRLFINLISNAYQYGKENGTIKVTLSESGENVTFSVDDDGIGIEADQLDKIWERFYRADPSRNTESGSMGLGLSMVKWITKAHSGDIKVKSEIGHGTTFTFTMPKEQKNK